MKFFFFIEKFVSNLLYLFKKVRGTYCDNKIDLIIFQNGINPAFHESIGDAITLGVMTPQHLQRLGLADDKILTNDIIILLRIALAKIPQIPYALAMEKWRWRVFEGKIHPRDFNNYWWKLYRDLMGIEPPNSREGFFDPAAKFHIVSNTPYIR